MTSSQLKPPQGTHTIHHFPFMAQCSPWRFYNSRLLWRLESHADTQGWWGQEVDTRTGFMPPRSDFKWRSSPSESSEPSIIWHRTHHYCFHVQNKGRRWWKWPWNTKQARRKWVTLTLWAQQKTLTICAVYSCSSSILIQLLKIWQNSHPLDKPEMESESSRALFLCSGTAMGNRFLADVQQFVCWDSSLLPSSQSHIWSNMSSAAACASEKAESKKTAEAALDPKSQADLL